MFCGSFFRRSNLDLGPNVGASGVLNPTGSNLSDDGNFCDPLRVGGASGTGTGGVAPLVAQPPANFWQPFRLAGHDGSCLRFAPVWRMGSVQPISENPNRGGGKAG